MTWNKQKQLFWLLAIPLMCLIIWGSIWFVEKQDERTYNRQIKIAEKVEKAKLPVKIYRGAIDGKEFEIEEFRPIR